MSINTLLGQDIELRVVERHSRSGAEAGLFIEVPHGEITEQVVIEKIMAMPIIKERLEMAKNSKPKLSRIEKMELFHKLNKEIMEESDV